MNRINLYIFSQIIKSCTLVFFIFVSIAWLMQISRLFSIMNNLQIEFLSILGLSMWLIPNLINLTLPFILIFGLTLAFIKFDKDKELIAIYSLGLSVGVIKKPLYILLIIALTFYLLFNFFFSPFAYEIYKEKEYTLRNTIEFDKINIANFIKLDNNLVIDFEKNNQNFEDILINFKDENNNLIFAKKGIIKVNDDKLIFSLFDGFKLVVNEEEIENLKFDNYKIEFPNLAKKEYVNFDKNTLGIYELLYDRNERNNIIIIQRLFDIIIILSFILYFYYYVIKTNNYSLKNLLLFIISSIFILIMNNFIENFNYNYIQLFSINILNILLIHFIGLFLKIINFYE